MSRCERASRPQFTTRGSPVEALNLHAIDHARRPDRRQHQVNELLGSADRLGLSAATLVSMSQRTPTSNYTAPAVNNLLDRIVAQVPQ
jgi:hypothetical protein